MRKTKKKKNQKYDLLIKIGLSALSFLIMLVFVELFLRALPLYTLFEKEDDLIIFLKNSTDPVLSFELKPDSRGYIYDQETVINGRGERGKLYPYEKKPGTKRLVFIGDSLTFGFGNKLNESYPYLLENSLNQASQETYEAINLGVYSYNTVQQVQSLKRKGLHYSPDIVVVGFYIANPEGYYNRLSFAKSLRKKTIEKLPSLITYILQDTVTSHLAFNSITTIVGRKQPKNFDFIYNKSTENWKNFEQALYELKVLSKKNNFKVLFVIHPQLIDFTDYPLKKYHTMVENRAKNHNFIVIDMLDYYEEFEPRELKIAHQDSAHPNHEGNKIISQGLFDNMAKHKLLE